MPFVGTEILEVVPGRPLFGEVVGQYIVVIDGGRTTPSGVLPLTGTFSVMNTATDNAFVYTGLPLTNYVITGIGDSVWRTAPGGGYCWFISGTNLWRITPATGALVSYPVTLAYTAIAYQDGNVYMFRASNVVRIFNPSTAVSTFSTDVMAAGGKQAAWAVGVDRMIVTTNGGTLSIMNLAGDLVDTTTATGGLTTGGAHPRGASVGRVAYCPTLSGNIRRIDIDTMTVSGMITPAGGGLYNLEMGGDGWLYQYATTGDSVVATSPITGVSDTTALPTTRTRRGLVFTADGRLWFPSGAPL